ncbi:hypothetical protein F8272_09000 [Lacticaseibacillus paracasei]|nr:hypothetical protein F8272_09000 [Lacticaseibacillus paracasei]
MSFYLSRRMPDSPSWRSGDGLSREIVVGGLPPTTRPDFEIARVLREFKAVPTACQPNRRVANSDLRCSDA